MYFHRKRKMSLYSVLTCVCVCFVFKFDPEAQFVSSGLIIVILSQFIYILSLLNLIL